MEHQPLSPNDTVRCTAAPAFAQRCIRRCSSVSPILPEKLYGGLYTARPKRSGIVALHFCRNTREYDPSSANEVHGSLLISKKVPRGDEILCHDESPDGDFLVLLGAADDDCLETTGRVCCQGNDLRLFQDLHTIFDLHSRSKRIGKAPVTNPMDTWAKTRSPINLL